MKADPWRDLDVIDERAPRFAQGFFAVFTLLGIAFSLPWIWPLLALQMLLGAFWDRRACLPCLAYFYLLQPLAGEGETEDSRPPRLATIIGALMLLLATALFYAGAKEAALALAGAQVLFALLSSFFDFCLGCKLYGYLARMRIGAEGKAEIQGIGLSGGGTVMFTHPLCSDCHKALKKHNPDLIVDVRKKPEMARRAGVRLVPTLLRVSDTGKITEIITL